MAGSATEQMEVTFGEDQKSEAHLGIGKVEITLTPKEKQPKRCWTENVRKVFYGLTLVIGIALSWVSTTQFMASTYSPTFNAPFFMVWFCTTWMLACYPVYITGSFLLFKEKRNGGVRSLYREDQKVYGANGLTVLTLFKYIGPFCLCWEATNYLYIRAIGIIQVTDVTALFATNTAFVYIFSWIWLKEKFILIPARSFSVVLSIVGTVVICQADGFGGGRAEGVILALGSAVGAALYKVLFFRCLGNASFGQVSLFLSLLGLFNLLIFWPIMLVLHLTNVETIDWSNLPTIYLCGSAALTLVFNFLVNFGIAVTFPLFIALGTVMGIPLNGVVDWLFRGFSFGWMKILGGALIIAGFLLMLVPESLQQKVTCWKEGQCPCERQKLNQEGPEPGDGEEIASQREMGQDDGKDWMRLEQDENEP